MKKTLLTTSISAKTCFLSIFVFAFVFSVSYIRLSIQGRNLGKEKKEAMEEISTLITQAYDKFSIHSRSGVEGFKSLTDHLIDAYAVRLVTVRKGSIVIILECPTLESLEHLWSDYRSGHLDKVAERYLVTDKIKKKLNLETICLETTIDEENYLNCKKALMKLPSPCSGEYKQNVWEVQLYQIVHEESCLAFQFQECIICQWCMGRSAAMIIIIVMVISKTTLMMITLIAMCTAPTP